MTDCKKSCECKATARPMSAENGAEPGANSARSSLFLIPGMDCAAEERLIRMALETRDEVLSMKFDLMQHELRVWHDGSVDAIATRLERLGLGAKLVESSTPATKPILYSTEKDAGEESRVMKILLGINAVMFFVEVIAGWIAQSTGLIADSLDMLADAAVYGLTLYAVGRQAGDQVKAAHLSGWLQLLLAVGTMAEVLRRLAYGSEPEPPIMMGIAFAALVANATCLLLLARYRKGGAHMKASWIFSTNDVLANMGVILAGFLVSWTGTNYPDLVIGTLIAALVLNGARRILKLQR